MSIRPTNPDPLAELKVRQRACLRLLYQNYNAKQIGRKLGISPHTVHRHLQEARRLTGISRSMDLAILLVRQEGGERESGERITSQDLVMVSGHPIAEDGGAAAEVPTEAAARNRNLYGILQRIGLIVAIALGAVALAGALLGGFGMIAKVFRAEQIDISDPPYRQ